MSHIYDETSHTWTDSYEDLPVSPVDGSPVIFVPRRIVRALPWINYDDFVQREFEPGKKPIPRGVHWFWWLVAIVVAAVFVIAMAR